MKIKSVPEDFVVDEIPVVKPGKTGEYTYFKLNKKNWTTQRAIQQIARRLRVSKKRIGFAGNKDKFAVTTQVCSAWKVEPEQLENVRLRDIEISVLGRGNDRINLGDLEGNSFKIVVRDVSEQELASFEKNFPEIKKKGFLNLFGVQRFGSAGNSGRIGKEIVNGNLESATKMFLTEHGDNAVAQEFGSFAAENWGKWKEIIKRCPDFLGLEKAVLNWLVSHPTDFGGALRQIPKPTRRIFVSAYQSEIWNKKASRASCKIIKIPPVEIRRMPELEMLGTERVRIVKPKKFKQKVGKDFVRLQFELDRGAYATEVVRSLFE